MTRDGAKRAEKCARQQRKKVVQAEKRIKEKINKRSLCSATLFSLFHLLLFLFPTFRSYTFKLEHSSGEKKKTKKTKNSSTPVAHGKEMMDPSYVSSLVFWKKKKSLERIMPA